jgi:hypothetical protein
MLNKAETDKVVVVFLTQSPVLFRTTKLEKPCAQSQQNQANLKPLDFGQTGQPNVLTRPTPKSPEHEQ